MKIFIPILPKADMILKSMVNLSNIIPWKKRRVFAEVDNVDLVRLWEASDQFQIQIHCGKRFPLW